MFAVCIRYADVEEIKRLPKGNYLCADCTEENRASKLDEFMQIANEDHGFQPNFTVQQVIVSGILQWNYQAQVYLGY